jgi:hypothetical protein
MADTILIKRESIPGAVPTTSQLALGELAVNTHDGKLYFKKNDGTDAIIEVGTPVAEDGVATDSIQDGAVTEPKLGDGAVTTNKLGPLSVTEGKIATGAITSDKLGTSAVTAAKIQTAAVTTNKIADSAVTSTQILDATITGTDIALSTITSANIIDGTITAADTDNTIAKQDTTTGSLDLPSGSTLQRTTVFSTGSLRYNTTLGGIEFHTGSEYIPLVGDNGIQITNTGIAMTGTYTGNFTATGNVTAYSDERLKSDWSDLSSDILDDALEVKYGTYLFQDTARGVGVSAQSLERILPEAVITDEDSGLKSVAYGNAALTLVLELNKKVAALEAEIKKLKGE